MRYISFLFLLFFLFSCTPNNEKQRSPLDYIPKQTAILIKVADLSAFKSELKNNDFLAQQKQTDLFERISSKISSLGLFQSSSSGLLAFSQFEEDDFEFSYITSDTLYHFNETTSIKKGDAVFKNTTYDTYRDNDKVLYSLSFEGNHILSSSQKFIESIISKEKNPIPGKLHRLYQIATSKKTTTVFIDPSKNNPFLSSFSNEHKESSFSFFSDWLSLDLTIDQKDLNLNGISAVSDSTKNFSQLFKNTKPLVNNTPSFAPIQADGILSYTFTDYDIFLRNQETYLENTTVLDSTFNTVEEIGTIYLDQKKAIVLNTYGSERISQYLETIKKTSSLYQGNEIIDLNYSEFLNVYFNPLIQEFSANHYTVLENAFVFASDPEFLQTIISNFKNGTTFNKGVIFDTAQKVMADEATLMFVGNTNGLEHALKSDFTPDFLHNLQKATVSNYSFAAQMVADNGFYHTHLIAKKTEKEIKNNTTTSLFTVALDDELASIPQFVTNHNNNNREVVVQDIQNNLYLISSKGKVLWKKQLKGSVQGKIVQVDLFKNGKLQLAFTTNNQFLVLDRNGKEVSGFRKSFKNGVLNPLAVFDYERNKNYRFVVTQGTQVKMFDRRGRTVNGFTYTKAESPVIGLPKHFRIGRKDYLVFQLENGQLRILDRVGRTRVKVSENINFSENSVFVYKNKFTVTDDQGVMIQVDPRGRLTETKFNMNKDHGMDATSNTLVFINDNILSIKGKKIPLDLGLYTKPKLFHLNNILYISIVDIQNQKVYLFDSNGNPIQNFPVYGNSEIDLADIDMDGKLELVTKNEANSLIIYKMN